MKHFQRQRFIVTGFVALVLLALPARSLATCCEEPFTVVFEAGVRDDYAPPTEPALPDQALADFLGTNRRDFDQSGVDLGFGHTFTDLPAGICSAELEIALMVAAPFTVSDNDFLHLEFNGPGSGFAWGRQIKDLAELPWRGTDQKTLTLDLADLPPSNRGVTNILESLADGDLDVFVQDDTKVDYATLTVEYCPPPPPCARPPSSMVGWWTLDEADGSIAHDIANFQDGTVVGTPQPIPGVVAGARRFDGDRDFVRVPDSENLDFGTGDFSADFWIRTDRTSGLMTVLDKREDRFSPQGFSVFIFDGELGLQLANGVGDNNCSFDPDVSACTNYLSNVLVADGEWHHVAITVHRDRNDGIRWYLDGDEAGVPADPTIRGGSLSSDAPLLLAGHIFPGNVDLEGDLDEVELFSRALYPFEIQRIFEAGKSGKCITLVHAPWDRTLCTADDSVDVSIQICNSASREHQFALEFEPLSSDSPGCTIDGPTEFQILLPDTLPLLIAPRGCRSLTVEIGRPADSANGTVACYQVTARNLETLQEYSDSGSVYDRPDICCTPVVDNPIDLRPGIGWPVDFTVENTSASALDFQFQFEAVSASMTGEDSTVSLNGQPPGSIVPGEVLIPVGESREVSVSAELLSLDPFTFQEVLVRDTASGAVLASTALRSVSPACAPGPRTLCLNDGRFRVEAAWQSFDGETGLGQAVPLTGDTGTFWFFNEENVEVVVKVLDGRPINGHWWLFYGALSNVEYTLTVTDVVTGFAKTFSNPGGEFASVGDLEAIRGDLGDPAAAVGSSEESTMEEERLAFLQHLAEIHRDQIRQEPIVVSSRSDDLKNSCVAGPATLCLNQGRFEIEVAWEVSGGQTGVGQAEVLTDETGYFWFFDSDNVELVIKVLDGRSYNGYWWVFYGALSNVEYTVTVTDTQTGNRRTYFNPSGNFASVADMQFPRD